MGPHPGDVWPHCTLLVCQGWNSSPLSREFVVSLPPTITLTRVQILFIGVMSDMYVLWDVVGVSSIFLPFFHPYPHYNSLLLDDTIARKVNGSDASSFAEICGCCPSQGNNRPTSPPLWPR